MRAPEYSYRITDYDRTIIPNRFIAALDDGAIDAAIGSPAPAVASDIPGGVGCITRY